VLSVRRAYRLVNMQFRMPEVVYLQQTVTKNRMLILRLGQNPAAFYLAKLEKGSRRPQKWALNIVAGILSGGSVDSFNLDWSKVRYQDTAFVRGRLIDEYAAATVNRILSALRGTLEQAWLLGQMSEEDYHRAARLSGVVRESLPAGRELSAAEIHSLFQNCTNDLCPIATRDAAILAVMYAGGLRRDEVTKLEMADYDETNRKLIVHGKRSKERTAYLADGAVAALGEWMKVRGIGLGPLFLAVNRGGHITYGKPVTPQAIYLLLKSRAKRAGVKSFSPHDLRRTFVSDLLEAGVDIVTVSKMAGHSRVEVTARYDRRPEQAKQRAAMLLKVPYGRI
jgi:integrase/recombinase XerD